VPRLHGDRRGRFVDLLEVDAATNTKVDEMRELLDTAQYMPAAGRFKVYIIDEVHMLSRHAFNSMLKTLEEPPEHVKFILATTDPQRLPVTILSRCLQFNLKPLTPPLIAGHLKHVLTAEKIPFEEPALMQVGKAASGSLRDSLSLLDQAIAHGGGKVTTNDVTDMLGTLGGDLVWPLLERIAEGDGKARSAKRSASPRAASPWIPFSKISPDSCIASRSRRRAPAPMTRRTRSRECVGYAPRSGSCAGHVPGGRAGPARHAAGTRRVRRFHDDVAAHALLQRFIGTGGATCRARRDAAARFRSEARAAPAAPSRNRAHRLQPPQHRRHLPHRRLRRARCRSTAIGRASCSACASPAWPAWRRATRNSFSFENNHLELVVPESQRMYAEKPYLDKLKADLAPHFGANLRITVKVGSTSGNSVAAARSREIAQKQASAAEAIEDDPFVRDLVRDLGAEVVPSSIRPLDEGGR
jgi:DNA polymerase-3 subunit gamma/tau